QPILDAAGIDKTGDEPVSVEAYGRLWTALSASLNDEFVGLGARPMAPGSFTLLCHSLVTARTLEQALRRALRFLHVLIDDPHGKLEIRDGTAVVVIHDAGEARSAFTYRTYWIILHGIICWLAGRRIPIRRIEFRGPEPQYCADYQSFFGAPVQFNAEASTLAFDATYLHLQIKRSQASLKSFLRRAPANILVRYKHDEGIAARLRKRLRSTPPSDWPSFPILASEMKMPVSTLRRRLQQEGQSYRSIGSDIRRDLAFASLGAGDRNVAEIAAELGYAEPSVFHRAFKKWSRRTPGAIRIATEQKGDKAKSRRRGSTREIKQR
ncbi:MAG: AraC family transcriptional regulator, partial [Proteobacteria bacterium]|nr:AraC family transcriptional regulator [Pseudomonadota bacterium]